MKYFDEEDAVTEYEKQLQKKDNEIERQKEIIRQLDIKNLELTTTLKEVREYILQHCEIIRIENENVDKVGKVEGIPLLEILDKENNNEDN